MWYFGSSNDSFAPAVKQFFEDKVPGLFISGSFTYTAKLYNGNILAAALYRNYNTSNVEIHLQAEGHFDRACLRAIFTLPFKVLLCNRLTAIVEAENKRIIRIVNKLGFEKEADLKNFYGLDKDAELYRLDSHKAEKWIT